MEEEKKKVKKNTIKKNRDGYGYKYTELAEINKYCLENDISYYQEIETSTINQKDYIVTYVIQNGETTKHMGCQIVEAKLSGINNPVQAYGSSLTYCRRYSLLMALGLATEDDDAESLSEVKEMSKEDAENMVIGFGRHKGKKLTYLIENESDYIDWLLNNSKDKKILNAIELLTGQAPISEEDLQVASELYAKMEELIIKSDTDREKLYEHYGVESSNELTKEQLEDACKIMEAKIK